MRYSCNVIRDILPLYHEKKASDESAQAIEEHLKECTKCQEFYQNMCAVKLDNKSSEEQTKVKRKQIFRKVLKILIGIPVIICALIGAFVVIIIGALEISGIMSKEEYNNIEDYDDAMERFDLSGNKSIWPESISKQMSVEEFKMIYYCPYESEYMGVMSVQYEQPDYRSEEERLKAIESTEYVGYYGATGFDEYDVLAIEASDNGFVYALSDGTDTIIYVAMIFSEREMNIDYEKYIPVEYLPEGFDATKDNPTKKAFVR